MELIARIVAAAFNIYYFLIIAEVLLSWFPHNRNNPVFRFVHEMTEPFLGIFRRMFRIGPRIPLDFSPIIALIALSLLESFIFYIIRLFM
ncbi:MAG: YggT family protein [Clostridia bacterium]|nr:YggT family protein [Clostridia bacterium]